MCIHDFCSKYADKYKLKDLKPILNKTDSLIIRSNKKNRYSSLSYIL